MHWYKIKIIYNIIVNLQKHIDILYKMILNYISYELHLNAIYKFHSAHNVYGPSGKYFLKSIISFITFLFHWI